MRAVVTDQSTAFRVEELPDPTPGPNDIVIKVSGCGICGSDLKAQPAMPDGIVMGHEVAGEVVAVGATARDRWREGMQTAVLPLFTCGQCDHCWAGDVAHCAEISMVGLGGSHGGFAEYMLASADLCFRLPDAMPSTFGPLVEPFAVGLHAARLAEISSGDSVLIMGGGGVGLTAAAWARQLGAERITVSDPHEPRRAAALALGATDTVNPRAEEVPGGYDVVIECAGKPGVLDASTAAVTNLGRVVIAGVCAEPDPFFSMLALLKEISIKFAIYYRPDDFRTVVDAFALGLIDPAPLRTGTVGFDGVAAAFASMNTSRAELKVIVDPIHESRS